MKRKAIDKVYSGMTQAFWGPSDPRRRQEKEDSKLIGKGHDAIANMPREAQHHEFNPDKYVEHLKSNEYEID